MVVEGNPVPSDLPIKTFRIHLETRLSRKKTTVFNDIGGNLERFYKEVVEHLQVYTPPAPKLKAKENETTSQYREEGNTTKRISQLDSSDIPSWWSVKP